MIMGILGIKRPAHRPFWSKHLKCSLRPLCLLLLSICLTSVRTQSFAVESSDSSFSNGGTRPSCWTVATPTVLDSRLNTVTDTGELPVLGPESTLENYAYSTLSKRECHSGFLLDLVLDEQDSKNKKTRSQTRLGLIAIGANEEFLVTIKGVLGPELSTLIVEGNQEIAIVLQLCPVGMSSICSPVLPRTFFHNESPKSDPPTKESRADILGIGTVVDYDVVQIQTGGVFENELTLVGAPVGIYSIFGSLLVLDENRSQILGATNIPVVPSEQLVTFLELGQEPPVAVGDWAVHLVIALSVIGGSFLLYLTIEIFRQRDAQLFKLTQGKFLIAMLINGLLTTSSLVLFEPKNDLYCVLYQPLITMPMHIMFSILVGRMWRIRAIISPLLLLTLEKKEHWTQRWINILERMTSGDTLRKCLKKAAALAAKKDEEPNSKKRIRRAITDRQLMRVIILLCLPQVCIQILIVTVQEQSFEVDFEREGFQDTGVDSCKDTYVNNALGIMSLVLILVLFLILLVLARASRDLPSLFNETKSLLDVSWVGLSLLSIGAMLILATRTYASAATVHFLVFSCLCGVTTGFTCFKIIWPKLEVAWSGSKVVVTKLIADHNSRKKHHSHRSPSNRVLGPPDLHSPMGLSSPAIAGLKPHATAANCTTTPIDSFMDLHREGRPDEDDNQSTESSVLLLEEEEELKNPNHHSAKKIIRSPSAARRETSEDWPNRAKRLLSRRALFRSTRRGVLSASLHDDHLSPRPAAWSPHLRIDEVAVGPNVGTRNRGRGSLDGAPQRSSADEGATNRRRISSVLGFSFPGAAIVDIRGTRGDRPTRGGHFDPPETMVSQNPKTIEYNPKRVSDKIEVSESECPPRRLLLRMIDVQRMLSKVNNALMTGLSVHRKDWEQIRYACIDLGTAFGKEVIFEWERTQMSPAVMHAEFDDSGSTNFDFDGFKEEGRPSIPDLDVAHMLQLKEDEMNASEKDCTAPKDEDPATAHGMGGKSG